MEGRGGSLNDTEHQMSAVMQMLNESASREVQLRTVLNKMQAELTVAREALAASRAAHDVALAEVEQLKDDSAMPRAA